MPRFTVITPCRNAESYIEETVLSVLGQTAVLGKRAELEYIVCDGASTDRTLEILRGLEHPALHVCSEPDRGMYDALSKGLRRASGDYVAYLNAGDYYHKCAFDVVAEVFERHPDVQWLTGLDAVYNEHSQIVRMTLPFRFRRAFFENGFNGTRLPPLQQESTFWRAGLLRLVDYDKLASLRLAGDFYLWQRFAREHEVTIVGGALGGFKKHPGQQSEVHMHEYLSELKSLARAPSLSERLLASLEAPFLKLANDAMRRRMAKKRHIVYDFIKRQWVKYPELSREGRKAVKPRNQSAPQSQES